MVARTHLLDDDSRAELRAWLRSTSLPQGQVTRARIVLALDAGERVVDVAAAQQVTTKTVHKWRNRFETEGVASLLDQPRSGRPTLIAPETIEKVLRLTTTRVPRESTHWSGRLMAEYANTTLWQVQQIWKAAGLKPHLHKTFKVSNDPDFAEKITDIVGLYMSPPTNAVVLSVDEKTRIQALDRTQPGLPLSENRIASRTHDYKRHGTTALFAAFNILTGEVTGRIAKRTRSCEFVLFLKQIERTVPKDQELHIVLDNLSAHKTLAVRERLEANPRVHFHFTPTSSSWLNAIEGWSAQLERRALYRGVHTSVAELKDAIRQFIRVHNKELAKPFRWTKTAEKIIASIERAKEALPN